MYNDIPDDLRVLIEPVIEEHGYELMNVETVHGRQSVLLRITIDNRAGDGRVSVDAIAGVSREIGTQLDAADAISGAYRLELSSPGLDRMLSRTKDFAAACGREVKIEARRPLDGRRRFKGDLVDFQDGVAELRVDGSTVRIAFDDIQKANVVYAFSSADFRHAGKELGADKELGAGRELGKRSQDERESKAHRNRKENTADRGARAARGRAERTDD
jgi:ribosome maturation factor RimP